MRILTAILAMSISSVAVADLKFTYTIPTTRVDGKALGTDLASCSIFDVTGSSPILVVKQTPATGTYTMTGNPTTAKKYAASCADKTGVVSALSTAIAYNPPVTPPPSGSSAKPVPSKLNVNVRFGS